MRDEGRDKCYPKHSCLGWRKPLGHLPFELDFAFVDDGLWILGQGWEDVLGNENLARV